MTVQSTVNKITHLVSDIGQTEYIYDFRVDEADHMIVYLNDVEQSPGDYIVNDLGSLTGGTITISFTTALDDQLLILREMPLTQLLDYITYGKFPSATHEKGLDYGVMIDQQLEEQYSRVMRFPVYEDIDPILPSPQNQYALVWQDAALVNKFFADASSEILIYNDHDSSGRHLVYGSIEALRESSFTPFDDQVTSSTGYYSKLENKNFSYRWDATETGTDNGGSIIKASAITTGRHMLRFSEPLEAEAFGIIADNGVTDNSAQISAALGAGIHIAFNDVSGIYGVNTAAFLQSGARVSGKGALKFYGSMATDVIFRGTELNDIKISGLKFIGDPSVSASSASFGCAIRFTNSSNFKVEGCEFSLFPNAGLTVINSTKFKIYNNWVHDIIPPDDSVGSVSGINIEDSGANGEIRSNLITDIGLTATSLGIGIRIIVQDGSSNISIKMIVNKNIVERCQTHGIIFYDPTASGSDAPMSRISNNTVNNVGLSTVKNTGNGIYCLQVTGVNIENNHVTNSNTNTPSSSILQGGIVVSGVYDDSNYPTIITGNTVDGDQKSGIRVTQLKHGLVISNNTILNCLGDGIYGANVQRFTISINTINGALLDNGIKLDQAVELVLSDGAITGNSIKGPATSIELITPQRIAITGNSLSLYTVYGLNISDSSFCQFTGNTVYSLSQVPSIKTTGTHVKSHASNNSLVEESGQSYPIVSNSSTRGDEFKITSESQGVPSTGLWGRGDILTDDTPTAGSSIGWVCTTSGTPGVWKTYGAIAA